MSTSTEPYHGTLAVISAASGGGKGRIIDAMDGVHGFRKYPTCTTRPPRAGEIDGTHYRFMSPSEFEALRRKGGLIEWERVHGTDLYGTPRDPLIELLSRGARLILEIDIRGFRSLFAYRDGLLRPYIVSFFVKVPLHVSLQRILDREPHMPKEEILSRMATAIDEMNVPKIYDFTIEHPDGKTAETVEGIFQRIERRRIEYCCAR